MEFHELSKLLFGNHLLASESTIRTVLVQHEIAERRSTEYVGLVKKPILDRAYDATIMKGKNGVIGVLPVKGPLTYEETGWEALCGMCSYENMEAQAEYMIKEAGVNQIILEVNSGGGQAYGCFELAQSVRQMADEYNVKITTYVDGVAFSGGYVWASIADEVILNPMAKTGSIGVVLPLVNTSQRDEKNGIKRVYVTAGKSKVPYDENGEYTKEALDEMQKQTNDIYKMFVDHVSTMRGISTKDVEDTEAKTFGAEDSVKLGLADKIMTKNEFYNEIDKLYGEGIMTITRTPRERIEGDEITTPALVKTLNEQLEKSQGEVTKLSESITKLGAEKVEEEKARKIAEDALVAANDRISELEDRLVLVVQNERKAKIASVLPEDQIAGALEFVSDLSDDKFNSYISTLQGKVDANKKAMEEIGSGNGSEGEQLSVGESIKARIKARQESK